MKELASTSDGQMIVTFLLDETGSMQSIKDDTIGGFNSYLAGLRQLPAAVAFTLLKFDSNRVEKVCVGKHVAEVADLTAHTYTPGAMTPLYDAAVKAIHTTEEVVAKSTTAKVLFVIQTDGQENASTKYKRADLAARVKKKTAAGWEFVFLGAGIDAYSEAGALGISTSNTMSYARGNTAQAFAAMNAATQTLQAGGKMAFTSQQKADAGDTLAALAKAVAPAAVSRSIVDDISLVS